MTATDPSLAAPGELLADALERGDLDGAAAVVAGHLWPLMRSDWPLLARVVQQLPDSALAANPALPLIREFARSLFLRSGAVNTEVPPAAAVPVEAEALPPLLSDMVLLQEMLAHRMRGDVPAAREVGGRLRERASRPDEHGRRPAHRMVGFHQLQVGITEALADDPERALRDFADALLLRDPAEEDLTEHDARLKSALVHASLGRHNEAERLLDLAASAPEVGEPFASQLEGTRIAARALIAVDRLAPEAAGLVLEATERNADTEMWPFALLASTRWSIATGDLIGVLDEVDRAAAFRSIPGNTLAASTMTAARGRALIMMGEFAAAKRVLESEALDGSHDIEATRARLTLYAEGPDAALAAARELVVGAHLPDALQRWHDAGTL